MLFKIIYIYYKYIILYMYMYITPINDSYIPQKKTLIILISSHFKKSPYRNNVVCG